MNTNKINMIEIKEGKIISIRFNTDTPDKYKDLDGCKQISNASDIKFYTDEAIYTVLKDIGFNDNVDLNLKNNNYKTYVELSKFIHNHHGIIVDGNLFVFPSDKLKRVKKVILNEDLSINNVELYIGECLDDYYSAADIDYETYIFMFALSGETLEEKDIEDMLKSNYSAEHYNGFVYNHYSQLERNGYNIVRKVISSNDYVLLGVFLVNVQDTLLKFEAIEKSYNSTTKQDILIGTVFYISNNNIVYMQ